MATDAPAYDVAILSDFRYPGGTSASVEAEVRAQATAGFSTVLVQVPSPHLGSLRGFNPRIVRCLRDGATDLAIPGEDVSARLLVLRHPRIFSADPDPAPRVTAEQVIMVINQGPRDQGDREPYYDLYDVRERVERYFGRAVVWYPIGPLVRDQVRSADPSFLLSPQDWHEIIDVDEWWTERPSPVSDVPVIGRHGRADSRKWPRSADEILQAYPGNGDFRVRILGGGELAAERLGSVPGSWDVLPFGSVRPDEFLRTIDYFVYFHDPDWVEAFGRTMLEAMASGTPVIVAEHFRALFEDAAIYATPDQVPAIVRRLHADWISYQAVSKRALEFVDTRFGYRSHVARLREHGVEASAGTIGSGRTRPNAASTTVESPLTTSSTADRRWPSSARVMMLSSNGAGLGHLTRLMAIARRLPDGFQTIIGTQSHAAPLARQAEYLTEYIPSRVYLDIAADRWNAFLHDRLLHLLATHRPSVVVFDGNAVYNGLLAAMADLPEITWVWVRRAMWKPGLGERWIERGKAFDFVLEPGEFAGSVDEGVTVAERDQARLVGPITYLDPSELLDARSAREQLGLDERPAVLVQLGAGNVDDIDTPSARICRYLGGYGFQVVMAQSPIATRPLNPPSGPKVIESFPMSRYLRGFDLVVSAAGYNSFHELIGFCIPSVFVPNAAAELDNQELRARYAASVGAALMLHDPVGNEMEEVLGRAVRPEVQAALASRCAELATENGAPDAAHWVTRLCGQRAGIGA